MDVLLLTECLDIQRRLQSRCWYYRVHGGLVGVVFGVGGVQASSRSLGVNDTCLAFSYICHDSRYSERVLGSVDTHRIVFRLQIVDTYKWKLRMQNIHGNATSTYRSLSEAEYMKQ